MAGRVSSSILSLTSLNAALANINTDALQTYLTENLYGTADRSYSLGSIYNLIGSKYSDSAMTTSMNHFYQRITGTATEASLTAFDANSTYTDYNTLKKLGDQLNTIDTILDLSSVVSDSKSLYDTIKEITDWIGAHEAEVTTANATYVDKGTIIVGTASFSADTPSESVDENYAFTTVTFMSGSNVYDGNDYKVFIEPLAGATDIGEMHVTKNSDGTFKLGITGNATGTFQWIVILPTATVSANIQNEAVA